MNATNQRAAFPNLKGLDEDEALRTILEGTAIQTGESFFSALVQNLARALDTMGPGSQNTSKGRAVYGLWPSGWWPVGGELRARHRRTPGRITFFAPSDAVFGVPRSTIRPRQYSVILGVPLLGLDGKVLGHLAVLDRRPMPESPRGLALFHIFAARAAAELQRLRAESQVREREEKLGRLVDSAMDAIMELDRNLTVTRVNRATQKVFNCSDQQIAGLRFAQFLSEEGAEKLDRLIGSSCRASRRTIPLDS